MNDYVPTEVDKLIASPEFRASMAEVDDLFADIPKEDRAAFGRTVYIDADGHSRTTRNMLRIVPNPD